MTTLPTERLVELLKLDAELYAANNIDDIIAALTRLIEVEKEVIKLRNSCYTSGGMEAMMAINWPHVALINKQELSRLIEVEKELATLKGAAADFDAAPEDGDFRPPHPIFALADENDRLRSERDRLQAELDANELLTNELESVTSERIQKLQAELAAIKAEVGPEPERLETAVEYRYGQTDMMVNADYADHYKHRAEHLAAQNAELVKAHEWRRRNAPKDELAWLVERGSPAEYAYMDDMGIQWTSDPNKAMRFARREDAKMFAAGSDDVLHICEHMWHHSPPAQQEQQT